MDNFEEVKPEENGEFGQEQEAAPLLVSEDLRSHIYEMARWARILAIVGFVFSGFMVLASFSAPAIIDSVSQTMGEKNNPYAAIGSTGMMIAILLFALLYFYPSLMLFRFSNLSKSGVLYGDQDNLIAGMSALKSFFKFIGIVTLAVVVSYGLIVFLAIIGRSAGMAG
ncbi:MAG: hypothetical protein V4594_16270 [Bacteroidota bacterium]